MVDCGKVLFYHPFSSRSMKICYMTLIEALAEKGHEVTVAMPFAQPKDAKYKVINVDPSGEFQDVIAKTTGAVLTKEENNVINLMVNMLGKVMTLHENAIKDPLMQEYLNDPNTKFDLVIVGPFLAGEVGYYLAHKFDALMRDGGRDQEEDKVAG